MPWPALQSLIVAALILVPRLDAAGQNAGSDWRSDWAVADGFVVEIDSRGFELPTAIAFVPNPGPDPKDPLYYVTELGGVVRVVTNDRSVSTFARDFFSLTRAAELPDQRAEVGLAGICLAPSHGYVFVTFAYQDGGGQLRNNIVRFETRPGSFGLEPVRQRAFTEIFARDPSAISHQIGPCRVEGGHLYVSVADGMQPVNSRRLESTGGKLLRMTLDGDPAPGNPFRVNGDRLTPRNYVWAYGLRNPFSLSTVGGRVFVADNGNAIDRFLEVERGGDYHWDGTDWSIGLAAAAVISPSVGPVQMDYVPEGSALVPREWAGSFLLATSGGPEPGPARRPGAKGIMSLPYDLETGTMRGVPSTFLRYRGSGYQLVTGVALGWDGLYVVPLMPDARGESVVLRVRFSPDSAHPFSVSETPAGLLLWNKGCYGCHSLGEQRLGHIGPPLDRSELVPRLQERLLSDAYLESLRSLDTIAPQSEPALRAARQEVIAAEGMERLRVWIRHKVRTPNFDNPASAMPTLGLTMTEAAGVADLLLAEPERTGTVERVLRGVARRLIPADPSRRTVLGAFALGLMIPLGAWLGLAGLRRRRA